MVNIIAVVLLVLVTAKIFHMLGYHLCFNMICNVLDMTEEEMDEAIDKKEKELKEIA
jgi:hypothetical protein